MQSGDRSLWPSHQLPAGETTLMATFTDPEHGARAMANLRAAGFDVVQLTDRTHDDTAPTGHAVVEWGRYGYEPAMVDDKWTSAAAWDNALGLDWGEGNLLTVVVPTEDHATAARIIEEAGGRLT